MRALSLLLLLHAGLAHAQWRPPASATELALWPKAPPDPQPIDGPEEASMRRNVVAGKPWTQLGPVTQPTLTVFSPKAGNSGAAVLVFPGGGYQILAIDLEGTEVCDWLTSRGVTCVLVKYRVPGEGKLPKSGCYPKSPVALEDAQRALRLVRHRAATWGIDPHRIGVLGFSAGGHLVAATSTLFDQHLTKRLDEADDESARPDFAIALYPGHLLENTKRPFELNPAVPVSKATPPTFLLQAEDDPVDPVENALVYSAALHRAGVPVELHLFAHGGHAFGLRRTDEPITRWPALVEVWLQRLGVLTP